MNKRQKTWNTDFSDLKKVIAAAVAFLCFFEILAVGFDQQETYAASKKTRISDSQVRKFLHRSCFIGNSVQLGRGNFTTARWNKKMGEPLFMARVSYSILNDRTKNHGFMIQYKGKEMQARYAIKASKKKYAFINMGMNDLGMPVSVTYNNYVRFLKEIRKTNPKIVIFIEACTPMRSDKAMLNNKNIRELNRRMKQYAKDNKKVCYVETNKPLRDKQGKLKKAYCSDNYVHLTAAGAEKWNSVTFKYVRKYLKNRKKRQRKAAAERRRKAAPCTRIVRWSSKKKHLYWNNDKIVKGIAVYKDKFFAFTKKGKFRKGFTRKLRRASKQGRSVERFIALAGKPKKRVYQDSCYGEGQYQDGFLYYKKFIITTLKNTETGKETISAVTSRFE